MVIRFGESTLDRASARERSARSSRSTRRTPVPSRRPARALRDAVSHLLGQSAVADLTIEDPPLEEVMRELFAHHDEGPKDQGDASS